MAGGDRLEQHRFEYVPRPFLPMALADLHRTLTAGAPVDITVLSGTTNWHLPDDDFPARMSALWKPEDIRRVLTGAGFAIDADVTDPGAPESKHPDGVSRTERDVIPPQHLHFTLRRLRTLPDIVGPGMRLLICGLNPSIYAADAGANFARPGNRFWPAAMAAGLVTRSGDPGAALRDHGVGFTDLVKRATTSATALNTEDYKDGLERVTWLVEWLRPQVLCVVGLAGWRAAVDRRATPGPQPQALAGTAVYLMPNTSGLNAHCGLPDFIAYLQEAVALTS